MEARVLLCVGLACLSGCQGASLPPTESAEAPPVTNEVNPNPTLRDIMRDLEGDVADLAHGLWVADRGVVNAAAQRIADHPRVTPTQMAAIQGELGEEFARFVQYDQAVHQEAVDLAGMAQASDGDLLPGFLRLQQGCMACHESFQNRVSAVLNP